MALTAPCKGYRTSSAPLVRRQSRKTSSSWAACHNYQVPDHRPPQAASTNNKNRQANNSTHILIDDSAKDLIDRSRTKLQQAPHQEPSPIHGAGNIPFHDFRNRPTSRTSEHTMIVHKLEDCDRVAGPSQAFARSDCHWPSASIVIGNYPVYQSNTHQVKAKSAKDDPSSRADQLASVERPSLVTTNIMLRSVSKEDSLLARGANPRTGIVTPGTHSASSSFDEASTLRDRGVAPLGKWRQKGNEWISLGLDQPTPAGARPSVMSLTGLNGLRTPRKLTSDPATRNMGTAPAIRSRLDEPATSQAHPLTEVVLPAGVPGAYPQTPQGANLDAVEHNATVEHTIRRKPVGSSTTKAVYDAGHPLHQAGACTNGITPQPLSLTEAARSSSAPMPCKPNPFSPGDVGKDLPALPTESSPQFRTYVDPFLDYLPDEQVRIHSSSTLSTSGQAVQDKELPCLLMSSGQFLSYPPVLRTTPGWDQQVPTAISMPSQLDSRSNNHARQYSYMMKPKQQWSEVTELPRLHPCGGRPMPLPVYDNPPLSLSSRGRPMLQEPDMIPRRARPHQQPGPHAGPSTTTFTSTNMYTTRTIPPMRHHREQSANASIQQDQIILQAEMNDRQRNQMPQQNISMNMRMNSEDLMSIPMPKKRPRATSRPQMPGRAEGMHSVPRIDNMQGSHQAIRMVPLFRSSPTGMQTISRIADVVEDIAHPSRPTLLTDTLNNHAIPNKELQTLSTPYGLSRRCSRCGSGFVPAQQPNTGLLGSVAKQTSNSIGATTLADHKQKNRSSAEANNITAENISTQTESLSRPGSGDAVEVSERDHSVCCQQCCKAQDCHEACLGHPSPAPSPNQSAHTSSATTRSGSASASPSRETDSSSVSSEKARRGRLALVRSAFKKSMKQQRSPGKDIIRTLTDKIESGPELIGPPAELSALPLSPATFWGGDRASSKVGAVEAAKAAMKKGSDFSSEDAAAAMNAVMPRKEARTKSKRSISSQPLSIPARHVESGRVVNSNQGRRVTGKNSEARVTSGPKLRVPTPAGSVNVKSRNASGASVSTTEIQVPGYGTLGFCAIWEMTLVPFEASRMWLRNHPRVMTMIWSILECGWDMGQIMIITGSRLWAVIFLYSKTGKLRLKNGGTAGGFVFDCVLSAAYLLIFMALGVCVMRLLAWIVSILRIGVILLNCVLWMVKKLMGQGLLW